MTANSSEQIITPFAEQAYTADMDLFDAKNAQAMLIGREEQAFDSPDYIYELKLDGDRCLAYLDPGTGTHLVNKRGRDILPQLPELKRLHEQAGARCILDGELVIGSGQKNEFGLIRSRLTTTNRYRMERLAREAPASFIAYDILYLGRESLVERPLEDRKSLMEQTLAVNNRLVVSRYIAERGLALYRLVVEQGLEGVVAKRLGSVYQMGKRTRDWVKFKNWLDDDFVVCGYYPSDKANVVSLVVGQYRPHDGDEPELVYKGHVVLGLANPDFRRIDALPRHTRGQTVQWGKTPADHPKTIWLEPLLVCKIEFMSLTRTGGLRQPVFRGLRDDKTPLECVEKDPDAWPRG
ncbi:MAG: DNA ligase [Deltaproteobacteria bacterium]|nr:DNA ligase [Deltaproteobacteria bacterium]